MLLSTLASAILFTIKADSPAGSELLDSSLHWNDGMVTPATIHSLLFTIHSRSVVLSSFLILLSSLASALLFTIKTDSPAGSELLDSGLRRNDGMDAPATIHSTLSKRIPLRGVNCWIPAFAGMTVWTHQLLFTHHSSLFTPR